MNRGGRIIPDKIQRMRLAETLDYLRTYYDDLTPGQQQFFNRMLDLSHAGGIDEDRQKMLHNIVLNHRGAQTVTVRSKY